jgi:hypothetical protein
MNVDRLDDIAGELITHVERVAGDDNTALYRFAVLAEDVVLVSGRAAIAFNVGVELVVRPSGPRISL